MPTAKERAFRCLLVDHADEAGTDPGPEWRATTATVVELPTERLPPGEVTIAVAYSSLNYKDAMACRGHRGIIKRLPHVPGIDAAGTVVASDVDRFRPGDPVLVTGYDLGQGHWGGWSQRVRVPADWVVPLPPTLTAREAMILGTAGFTAAQGVIALQQSQVEPTDGEIVVTGATGGVGSLAIAMLAWLGYRVVAVTGKTDLHDALRGWGAARVIDRAELVDTTDRPLLSARWAGAIDTVGGDMLTSLLRGTRYGGCVAACGLVAGSDLSMTLYPFLLRGVTLAGLASADCPRGKRERIWGLLAGDWKPRDLESFVTEVELADVPSQVDRILAGRSVGRVLVRPA